MVKVFSTSKASSRGAVSKLYTGIKRHWSSRMHKVVVVTGEGVERCLLLIPLLDANQMIGVAEIKLGEDLPPAGEAQKWWS